MGRLWRPRCRAGYGERLACQASSGGRPGPVVATFQGTITTRWGRRWRCDHSHLRPSQARLCAERELDGLVARGDAVRDWGWRPWRA